MQAMYHIPKTPERAADEAGRSLSPDGSAHPSAEDGGQNKPSSEACNPGMDNTILPADHRHRKESA